MFNNLSNKLVKIIPFLTLLLMFIIVRAQTLKPLDNNLYGLDPYLFYRYAYELRLNKFHLVDEYRYFPNGDDLSRELPLTFISIYLISYLVEPFIDKSKFISYEEYIKFVVLKAAQIYPLIFDTISFVLFLLIVYFFTRNYLFTFISGLFLLIPSSQFLFRTVAGWADKEPMALTLILSSFLFYYLFLEKENLVYSILTGISIFLGVLTWGGFKMASISLLILLSSYTFYNLEKFKSKKLLVGHIIILIYSLLILFVYYLYNPQTIGLHDIIAHLRRLFMLIPIGGIGLFFYINYFYPIILKNIKIENKILRDARVVLLFVVFTLGLPIIKNVLISLYEIFPTYGLSTVAESQPPSSYIEIIQNINPFIFWSIFFIQIITGLFFILKKEDKKYLVIYYLLLCIFYVTFFSHNWKISSVTFFFIFIFLLISVLFQKIEYRIAIFLSLSFFGIIVSYRMVRLFFIANFVETLALPILLYYTYNKIILEALKNPSAKTLATISVLVYLIAVTFESVSIFSFSLNYLKNLIPSVEGNYKKSLEWMRDYLEPKALVYHWWDYGYWVQTIANKITVVDGGNKYPIRNEYVARYLFNAKNPLEMYCLFKKYGGIPDYIYVVSSDIFKYYQIARWSHWRDPKGYGKPVIIGVSTNPILYPIREKNETKVYKVYSGGYLELMMDKPIVIQNYVIGEKGDILANILLNVNNVNDSYFIVLKGNGNIKLILNISCICKKGYKCIDLKKENSIPICIYENEDLLFLIPYKIKDTFFVKAFILNSSFPGVIPIKEFGNLKEGVLWNLKGSNYFEYVKIWKIDKKYFYDLENNNDINCSKIIK